jgi:UDP-N-acetylglucosamine acyltransferase
MLASGVQTRVRSINAEGMRRRGFSTNAIAAIKRAFKIVYRGSGLLDQSLKKLEETISQNRHKRLRKSTFTKQTPEKIRNFKGN